MKHIDGRWLRWGHLDGLRADPDVGPGRRARATRATTAPRGPRGSPAGAELTRHIESTALAFPRLRRRETWAGVASCSNTSGTGRSSRGPSSTSRRSAPTSSAPGSTLAAHIRAGEKDLARDLPPTTSPRSSPWELAQLELLEEFFDIPIPPQPG